jgi:hypothetical protein
MTRVLAIDPGVMNGWAITDNGVIENYGQLEIGSDFNEFIGGLSFRKIDVVVVENFRIRPGINFSWNEMAVIQVIGIISYVCWLNKIPMEKQEPANYSIGAKWAGITIPKNHDISHGPIAYAHATYYNHKKLGLPIPALKKMQKENPK